MENGIKNEIIVGQTYGSTAIFFQHNMFCNVSAYSMDSCGRCVGISFAYKAGYCFVCNLYLLCLST